MNSFDLRLERWIPVMVGSQRCEVSLFDLFARASEIDSLALDDPLAAVAILRQVLLPVLLHAMGAPRTEREWIDRWQLGAPERLAIETYLGRYDDRFDLFHPEHPFAQVANLRTAKEETKPISVLMPEIATGNNVPLFSGRTEADSPALSPAQAARVLLKAQCWDTAAIKSGAVGDDNVKGGKTTGNPISTVGQLGVVIPLGRNLAESLVLNTLILPQGIKVNDEPQWAREPRRASWETKPASGLLDLLSWQSRRIRLIPESAPDGSVVIRRVVLAAGDRLSVIPRDIEPHTAWRKVETTGSGQPPVVPIRHRPGRATWQGLASLLATREPNSRGESSSLLLGQLAAMRVGGEVLSSDSFQVLSVGVVYGNQSAVVEDVIVDTVPLSLAALQKESRVHQLLIDVVDQTEQLRRAADGLASDLRQAAGAERQQWNKGDHVGEQLVFDLGAWIGELLADLQVDPESVDAATERWRSHAFKVAEWAVEPALDAAPPSAFLGRVVEGGRGKRAFAYRLSSASAHYLRQVREILGVEGM